MHTAELIDIKELSKRKSIPVATLYSWRHREVIPQKAMLKVQGKLLFDPTELDKWLEEFRGAPKA